MEFKALVKMLLVRLEAVKAKKLSNTLDHVQSNARANNFAATVAEMEAKTIGGTLRDVEAKGMVDTTAGTPQEVKVRITPRY